MIIYGMHIAYWLLAFNAILLAAFLVVAYRFATEAKRWRVFWQSPTGAAIAQASLTPALEPLIDAQFDRLRANIHDMVAEHEVMQRRNPLFGVYENAIRTTKDGASTNDLVEKFGLSAGEASLLQRFHTDPSAMDAARNSTRSGE